jgi:hypothetical protein
MEMKKYLVGVLAIILSVVNLNAQKIAEVNLTLLDGNIIKGMSLFSDIDFQTQYGRLLIPIANVSNVVIGIGKDNSTISTALPILRILSTSSSEDTRKAAYNDLVKMGPKVLFTIDQYLNDPKNTSSSDYNGDYTVDNAINDIRQQANLSTDAPYLDVLTIDNLYTMGGTYSFTKLDVKTEYGTLSIPKEKIKSMDVALLTAASNGEFSFRLFGNKNISGNQNGGWLKTGITLKSGQSFQISATGEVVLASLSNGKYKPDGSYKAATGSDVAAPPTTENTGEYDTGSATYPSYGQVIYRIGESATEMNKAGKKFSGIAKQSGSLYLSIYETVFNQSNTGSYSVKVTTGGK